MLHVWKNKSLLLVIDLFLYIFLINRIRKKKICQNLIVGQPIMKPRKPCVEFCKTIRIYMYG